MRDCYRHEGTQTRHLAHQPSSPKATEKPMGVVIESDAQQLVGPGGAGSGPTQGGPHESTGDRPQTHTRSGPAARRLA